MQRITSGQLSLRSRVGYLSLLVASLTMAAAIGSLLATEPILPARARLAFMVIVCISLAWAAFSAWVLSTRRVMFGRDRVIGARMALTFCVLSTVGMLALGAFGGVGRAAYLAAAAESVLCVVAGVVLLRAKRRVDILTIRKRQLEQRTRAQG
jgi:hypothetical protein